MSPHPSLPQQADSHEALQLAAARDEFVAQWGAMGSSWGINRTMAQIHAWLMITSRPVSTDDVMAELKISRGNAHMNLRELVGWGLVRSVIRKGERKEFFEAEKDVWKMFCIIVRERKRREIQPAIGVLKSCVARVADLQGEEATAFSRQTQALCDFMEMADKVLSRVARSEASTVLPWAMRYLSR